MAPYTPAELLDLSDEDFAEVVDGDLRNKLDGIVLRALSSPEVVYRWRARLEQMSVHSTLVMDAKEAETEAEWIDQTLADKADAAEEARSKNLRVRASALRFQAILKHRTIHVEWLIASYVRSSNDQASRLAEAIVAHRSAAKRRDPADYRLWAVLEDIQAQSALRSR